MFRLSERRFIANVIIFMIASRVDSLRRIEMEIEMSKRLMQVQSHWNNARRFHEWTLLFMACCASSRAFVVLARAADDLIRHRSRNILPFSEAANGIQCVMNGGCRLFAR